jgi:hypothetical protein
MVLRTKLLRSEGFTPVPAAQTFIDGPARERLTLRAYLRTSPTKVQLGNDYIGNYGKLK